MNDQLKNLISVFIKLRYRYLKENKFLLNLFLFSPILLLLFPVIEIIYYSKLDIFYQKTLFNIYFLIVIVLAGSSILSNSFKAILKIDELISVLPIRDSHFVIYNVFRVLWYNKLLYLIFILYFFAPFWIFHSFFKYPFFVLSLTVFSLLLNTLIIIVIVNIFNKRRFFIIYSITKKMSGFITRLMYFLLFVHIFLFEPFLKSLHHLQFVSEKNVLNIMNDFLYNLLFSRENILTILIILVINLLLFLILISYRKMLLFNSLRRESIK